MTHCQNDSMNFDCCIVGYFAGGKLTAYQLKEQSCFLSGGLILKWTLFQRSVLLSSNRLVDNIAVLGVSHANTVHCIKLT